MLFLTLIVIVSGISINTYSDNGSGAAPFVEKKWEFYLDDSGQRNLAAITPPVMPKPGEERLMMKCIVACDTDGKDDIKEVQAWVLSPPFAACKNSSVSLGSACETACAAGMNSTECLACILAECPPDNFSKEHEATPDLLKRAENGSQEFNDCDVQGLDPDFFSKGFCSLYAGSFAMNYSDGPGNYSVLAMVTDNNDSIGFMENLFAYGGCVGIEINSTAIDFGQVKPGETKASANIEIRNICNTEIDVARSHTAMAGMQKGDTIEAGKVTASINNMTSSCADVNLQPGSAVSAEAALSVPLGTLPDTYTGNMTFTATACI
ncbi:MAG: hypothetical protein HYX24_00950 [Candidatus Aenigmarchaeota archaeon]|nr:hypothetical protein [Candidatus Aenigmarchaeota archaeon]